MSEANGSAQALRDAFLAAPHPPLESVDIPECGITVYVLALSAREKDALEKSMVTGKGRNQKVSSDNLRARYCERCMADEYGTRLFADGEAEAIGNLPAAIVDRVFTVISRINSTSEDDLEELAGNSSRGRSAISS